MKIKDVSNLLVPSGCPDKLQLLVAVCWEISDRLNMWCCSTCAMSCLNFKKVPDLYGFLRPMHWMWCTRDLSTWGFKCHQLYGMCCAGPSHHVWAYPGCSSGTLSQACPFHSYPPTSKMPQNSEQICSFSKSLAAGLVQFHRSFSSHDLFELIIYFSLMSKAWEWREAELFCTLVLAS